MKWPRMPTDSSCFLCILSYNIDMPTTLSNVMNTPNMSKNVQSSFKSTSLLSFNPNIVDYSKVIIRSVPTQQNTSKNNEI